MEFRVTDLLIDAAKKAPAKKAPAKKAPARKKVSKPKRTCGKPTTCYKCTRCTSTAASRHKSPGTFNTCGSSADSDFRMQLLTQLRDVLAAAEAPGDEEKREAA